MWREGKESTMPLDTAWQDALLTASAQQPTGHLRVLPSPSPCPCTQSMYLFSCQEHTDDRTSAKHRTRANPGSDHREPELEYRLSWASQQRGQPLGYNSDLSKKRGAFNGNIAWATCDGLSPSWLTPLGWVSAGRESQQDCPCDSAYGEDWLRGVVRRARKDINLDCGVYHGLKKQKDTLGSKIWWIQRRAAEVLEKGPANLLRDLWWPE